MNRWDTWFFWWCGHGKFVWVVFNGLFCFFFVFVFAVTVTRAAVKVTDTQPHLEGVYFPFTHPRCLMSICLCVNPSSISKACWDNDSEQKLWNWQGTLVALCLLGVSWYSRNMWTCWKFGCLENTPKTILSLQSMYSKKEAVPCADPFEVCHFLSPTFCFFCSRLTSMEKYWN